MSGPRPHTVTRPQSSGTIEYPVVIDTVGQPVSPRSEDYIEGTAIGERKPFATAQLGPMGWNDGKPGMGSRMVGWALHRAGSSQIIASHAFSINPQAITRAPSNRNQLYATQGGFYVDDFGEGSETITITQLVAHGRGRTAIGGSAFRATMRADVVRWYDQIYTRASANPGQYDVYFYDNHFWASLDANVPEKVYFPQQAVQIVRSVQLHNVWQLQIVMGTLRAPETATNSQLPRPGHPQIRVHIVRRGETLKKIAVRLVHRAHHKATHKRIEAMEHQIIALTKKYGHDDIAKNRDIPIYTASNPNQVSNTVHVKRMHVHQGEKIILPRG